LASCVSPHSGSAKLKYNNEFHSVKFTINGGYEYLLLETELNVESPWLTFLAVGLSPDHYFLTYLIPAV